MKGLKNLQNEPEYIRKLMMENVEGIKFPIKAEIVEGMKSADAMPIIRLGERKKKMALSWFEHGTIPEKVRTQDK